MVYPTLDQRNTSEGIQVLFSYANDVTGGLMIKMVLVSFFLVVTFASYYSVKRTSNKDDMPVSVAVGSFLTSILAILFSLIPDMINRDTLIITISITIMCVAGLFVNRSR
jgi:low temperature requirement protein LtrA